MGTPLDTFLATLDLALIERTSGWKVERAKDGDIILIELRARDGETYRALCLCDGYPTTPPSVAFVNAEGSKNDPKVWPHGNSTFLEEVKPPPNSFLCMPLTREGLAHHGDWRGKPEANAWDGARHTVLDIFNHLQRLLNSPNYTGRGGS